ncbi:MAG: gliding motility-associated C-terminal domain-containing protein [Flavobacteriales bacterium]|nr:gliding motility-associated C-terminal domain-containing protein [Flavobacteriales bacterium]MBL0037041.1 gliding motility-associated C-terminal domain-containing protein [Flavobacteriales bacterium]
MAQTVRTRFGALVRRTAFRSIVRTALAVSALLFLQGEARATHAMGGEISYTCLGGNQYKVTLNFYRDCNGVAAPTNCNNGLAFNYRSTACNANVNSCFAFESVQVITPICPSETDRCTSTSGVYGVEKYTFSKIINLTQWAGCGTDWVISWELCCRNNAITSLQNPGNQSLFLDARLNNTVTPCNNSPQFLSNPTPFYCLGQSVSYNPGASDPDGDQLQYALIAARGAGGANLTYNGAYSAAQPIVNTGGANAVTLNPTTGTMTVVPSIQQVAVLTYRVREFRNGVQVGEVTRDVQVVVRQCAGNTAPNATGINGTNQYSTTVCAGTPVNFTINSSDANAGQAVSLTWNNGIPGATFTTSGSPLQTGTFSWTPTIADIGNQVFVVTAADNACPLVGTNDFGYSITVTPPNTAANAGPAQQVCGTTATLAGVLPYSQVTGTWTVVSGSGTFANANNPTTTVSGLSAGNNVFQWTVNYAPCGTASAQVTITSFNPSQAAANAGPDQQLCLPANSATLAGNTATAPAVGTWTLIQGSGTITTPLSPSTTVTGLGVGVNRFRWTINNGPCAAPTTDDVLITVFSNAQTPANAGPDQSICTPTNSVTMNANALIGPATGTWSVVSGSGSFSNAASPTTNITGLVVGVHTFQWTVNNGACGSTNDQVTITVFSASSPNANAGPDQQVCTTSSVMTASAPTAPATGAWTLVSGTGTFANATSPFTAVSGLSVGANVFQWTVNNGPCANGITTDQVTITVFSPGAPAANAGADQSICSTTPSTTMAGNTPLAPSTGTWALVSGSGTITAANSPTTTISGLGVGQNVFSWTINNGPCGAPTTDQVTVFVYSASQAAANAGPDQSLCTPTISTTLAGNAPTFPATGQWTVVSGSATFANAANPFTAVTNLGQGTNVLRWTINNGPCANPITSDEVTINIFNISNPIAFAGADQELCNTNSSTTISASGLVAPATGAWTLVSGSGSIANANSNSTTVSGLGVGVNTFQWSVNNGPCGTSSDQVSITVFDANSPGAAAGPDQELCRPNFSTNLQATAVFLPAQGQWTVSAGTGIFADDNDPATLVSGLSVGTNTFRWQVSNGPCGPQTIDEVTILVFDDRTEIAYAGPDISICVPTFPNSVNLVGSALIPPATGLWTLVSGSGTIASPNASSTAVTNLSVGVNVFQWTVDNGPCANPLTSDQISVFVYDAATPAANAGLDQNLCTPISTTVLSGSSVIFPAAGTWSLVSGSGIIVDPTDPGTQVTGLTLGPNVFRWTVNNGVCSPAITTDDVVINVFNGAAQPAAAGPDQAICDNAGGTTLAGNAPVGLATGFWTVQQGTAVFANAALPNTSVTGLSVGINTLIWNIDNGACGISQDPMTVLVYDSGQSVAIAGPDQSFCLPVTETTLNGSATIFPGQGVWTVVTGSGSFSDVNDPLATVTGLSGGVNTFLWTVDNGPCSPGVSTDQVSIFIYDPSTPIANAGPDQSICTPITSATMQGSSIVAPAEGAWTVVQGTGSFVDFRDPNTVINGLSIGENIFRWTVDNGACNGVTTDDVSIFVFDRNVPIADAGVDKEFCLPTNQVALQGSSYVFPATGQWTLISGTGTIADLNDPATVVTGLGVGENIFQWTVDNGPCTNGATTDQVSIFIFDDTNPAADAGADQELCTPNTGTSLSGSALIFPAVGTWTLINGTGTITDPNDPNTSVSGLSVGENIFEWAVDNGPCANGNTTDQVSIFVFDENNPVADAGPDQELCTPTSSTTLAGSSFTFPASGQWIVVQGAGVFSDSTDPNTTVSGLAVGENIFQWSVANGPCANPLTTDQVSIFVFDANNLAADAGTDQELCTPNTSTTLSGSALTFPATGTWTLVQGAGTITDANDPTSTVTDLAIGVNVFAWTVSNGPCANGITNDQVSIVVFDENTVGANAGPDQELCTPANTVNLQGSGVSAPSTGTWTLISGTGTIVDPNDPNTLVSGLSVGENIFEWAVDNGPCANGNTTDQVSIFVFDANNLTADAGTDQELCTPADNTTLAGSALIFPAVGTWTLVSGTGTITDPNDPNSAVTGLAVGTNVFQWSVDNGPCVNGLTTDQVSILVFDENNPVSAAGPDQDLCTPTTSATLTGSAITSPAVGTWTVISGSGTFADANDPATTVSALGIGANTFVWTVSNGPCASAITSDTLTITLYDDNTPAADAGADQELCTPTTNTTLTGSAVSTPAVGTWTVVTGTGIFADPNDPNTDVSGLSVGLNVFQWAVTNGPCTTPFSSDQVTITVFDENNPVANAGNDQQVCTPLTGTTLAGSTVIFPATGQWTLLSGTGTITDAANPASTVTGLGIGENIFVWTVSNGPCASGVTTDQVSIFLFDLNAPPADAGPDQEQCTPNTSTTLAGNTPTGAAVGTWSLTQGNATFVDVNDPTSDVSGLTVGENILTWTVDNGICGISSDNVSIFIFDENNAPANAGPDVEICTPQDSIFLAGNTPTFPATGTWSLVAGAGLFEDVNDPTSKVVGLSIGSNTFVWTVDNGPCNNPFTLDSMTVILYDDSTSAANAGPDLETCIPLTAVQLLAVPPQLPATGTWSIVSGSGTVVDPTDPTSLLNNLSVGITTLVWTLDNGPCPDNGVLTDTVLVFTYDPNAPVANAGPDQELCTPQSSTTLEGNVPSFPGEGTWSLIAGTGLIADANDPATTVTGLTIGVNTFVWTIYNGQCGFGPPSTDTVNVVVFDDTQAAADAGPDQEQCTPNNAVVMAANTANFPAVGTWTIVNGTATIVAPNSPTSTVSNISVGINVFVWTIDNGACGTTADTVIVEIYDLAAAPADAGPDQEICVPTSPNTVTMAGNVPVVPATGLWTLVSGSATIVDPTDPATSITDLTVGVHVFLWTLDNGPCGSATSDQVTVTVYDAGSPNANAGPDQQLCTPTTSAALNGSTPTFPAAGTWSIVSGTGALSDPTDPAASITGLVPGITVLVWTVDNGPCANGLTTDTVTITLNDANIQAAAAGPDQSFCTPITDNVTMLANLPSLPAFGTWALMSGTATIAAANDPFTAITDLGMGENVLGWTIDNGACGTTSDQISLFVYDGTLLSADAGADQAFCQDTTTTLLAAVPVGGTSTSSWSLVSGTGTFADAADPATAVSGLTVGFNAFVWTVNNGECGTTTDTMFVELKDCTTIIIPDAFSPNSDGKNDLLVIQGLEYYPDNAMLIFNRWGNKVLDRHRYQNDWDGRSEGNMNWGDELPEGTYYYVLDLGNGDEALTGYIYLRR